MEEERRDIMSRGGRAMAARKGEGRVGEEEHRQQNMPSHIRVSVDSDHAADRPEMPVPHARTAAHTRCGCMRGCWHAPTIDVLCGGAMLRCEVMM